MSIYGSAVFNESYNTKPVITDTIESIMEDDSIVLKDENEDFVTEGLEAVAVMTENYSNFMQRVGISELNAIYATGDEMIYTESVVGDFFGGIKKFLMKIWDKIKSLFKRFIMVIDSYTKNDKAFINKYRQQIYRHKSLSDFTFKGYKYVIKQDKIEAGINEITSSCSAYLSSGDINMTAGDKDVKDAYGSSGAWDQSGASKIDEKHDDRREKLRGAILDKIGGKAGAYTSEEYRKEIDELLRSGESEKQELDDKDIDVDEMVTEVQNNRDTKKTYDRLFRDSKKSVDQNIKDLDKLQRDHIKNNMPSKDEDLEKVGASDTVAKDSPNLIRYANNILKANSKDAISSIGALNNTDEPGMTLGIEAGDSEDKKKERIATYVNAHKDNSGDFSRSDSKRRAAYLNNALKVTRATKEMLVTLDSCVLKALKDRNRQFKACLVKIAYHNPKNESFTESYNYDNYNNYNFISNIQFK